MKKMRTYKILPIIILIFIISSCQKQELKKTNSLSISEVMNSKDDSMYSKALEVKKFIFPIDNGSHQDYKNEWWYFTGNLSNSEGKEFGYQFTMFRSAIKPVYDSSGNWETNNIYMGHFTITDINENKFYYSEKLTTDANKLAGAIADPLNIWIENWKIQELKKSIFDFPEVNIKGITNKENFAYGININLKPIKPIVLQGDNGLSKKGMETGNASYYYTVSRLETEGKINIGGKEYQVRGLSWLDREWSTSALSKEQQGWDWFSLQFDNNTEIMYYQLRKKDNTKDIFSRGVYIDEKGKTETLNKDEAIINVSEYWKSETGNTYPSGWTFEVPEKDIFLSITPSVKNQELPLSIKYWEGAVKIKGKIRNKNITGNGYVELTGYD